MGRISHGTSRMTEEMDNPNNPYTGMTCQLAIPAEEIGELAAVFTETMVQGGCIIQATAMSDAQKSVKLVFNDHQFRSVLEEYLKNLAPDSLNMAWLRNQLGAPPAPGWEGPAT